LSIRQNSGLLHFSMMVIRLTSMDPNGLLSHVTELEHVFAYEAPRALPRPREIRPDEELVEVVTDGKVDFTVGDKLTTFGRGSMFWHQAGQETIHLNHIEEPYRCLSLVFRVTGQPVWHPPRVCRWKDVDGVLAFARLMLDVDSDRPFGREFQGHHAYARLLLEAQRAVRHELLSQPWPAALARAVTFLEEHFAEPVKLAEMASHARISLPHLHGLFAKHLKRSPHSMMLELRLRKARTLLLESDLPLKQIAFDTGFSSPQYFCRLFSKHWGRSPGAFRLAYRVPR